MKTLVGMGMVGIVSAVALAPVAGATIKASSGDTCVATGSGTVYTVVIALPSDAPEQAGFAFGASGVSITDLKLVGTATGTVTSHGLPANTTAGLLLSSPGVPPGASVTASLKTSRPLTGSLTVVPADSSHKTYFDPVVSQVLQSTLPSNKFTVKQHVSYDTAARVWHLAVVIPGPGVVSATQQEPSVGTQTRKSQVHVRRKGLRSAGTVTLVLQPTANGLAALAKNGSLTVKLAVEFAPKGGKPASKLLRLTLKK
jgi:hypothetical protein